MTCCTAWDWKSGDLSSTTAVKIEANQFLDIIHLSQKVWCFRFTVPAKIFPPSSNLFPP